MWTHLPPPKNTGRYDISYRPRVFLERSATMSEMTSRIPACNECGSDPIPHRLTYIIVTVDEAIRPFVTPGNANGFFARTVSAIEQVVTPPLFKLFLRLGLAKRVNEPDEHTLLLALMLWQDASNHDIEMWEFRLFGLPRNLFFARLPNGKEIVFEGIPLPSKGREQVSWIDNKAELKRRFRKLGFPIAKGGSARTYAGAKRIYESVTPPVIVKPYSGSGSRHTTLHIDTLEELKRGHDVATMVAPLAVIEEELVGPVFRATVVDGKLVATLRRDPPHVIGDGVHTILELIEEANKNPKRSGPYFSKLTITPLALEELKWQHLTPESVPEKGQRVQLNQKVNWGLGGTTADVSDHVHPDNKKLFEDVAKALKAPIVGIDFIIADMGKSWKEQERCGVIECNSMPFFDNHHLPFEGEPRNVAGAIWKMLLTS